MKLSYIFFICLISASSFYAVEYLYPVGTGVTPEGNDVVYLIYQRSLEHVELFAWDPIEGIAHKALLSAYTPAFFNLLPDNSGFSFIDQGRIRIKQFEKRAPFTIPLYAPIDTITSVEWIDAQHCYFTARYADHFGIFATDFDGNMTTVLSHESYDFLYPQQRKNQLFFIRHTTTGTYDIGVKGTDENDYHIILNFEDTPIAFLRMIDEEHGFAIQHQPYLDRHDTFSAFACWYFKKTEGEWKKERIFEFNIPLDLFFGDTQQRFYESIVPFLPVHINGNIFFIHHNTMTDRLGLYRYELQSEKYQLAFAPKMPLICCSPTSLFGLIFYGGNVVEYNDGYVHLPSMYLDNDYAIHVTVPFMMPTQTW